MEFLDIQKCVCFTGHRPEKLVFPYAECRPEIIKLKEQLREQISLALTQGYRIFYSGMAKGVDIIASEIVLSLRTSCPDVKHYAVIPYLRQCYSWENSWIARYQKILQQSDKKLLVSQEYTSTCFRQRNHFLVNHSNLVIAVFNDRDYNSGTWQTIQYAQKRGKEVRLIKLPQISGSQQITSQLK